MEVPWQCPRCALHNVSHNCAACMLPRPAHLPVPSPTNSDGFSDFGRTEVTVAPDIPPQGRASRNSVRPNGSGVRTWPTSPENDGLGDNDGFLGNNAATFNPAEIPQEFTGIGQAQPPPGNDQQQQIAQLPGWLQTFNNPDNPAAFLTTHIASTGYCVPFVALLLVLFLFRHLYGIFMFLSTWNTAHLMYTRITEEIERKEAIRRALLILYGVVSICAGVVVVFFVWDDGLVGMYKMSPQALILTAAQAAHVVHPSITVDNMANMPQFNPKSVEEMVYALPTVSLESIVSVWEVLWLVSMNHLAVAFFLYGIRGIVFAMECPNIRWVSGHGTHAPLSPHPNEGFHASQFKSKKRFCAFVDGVGTLFRAVTASIPWICFFQIYGEGSAMFDEIKEFVVVYVIVKAMMLIVYTRMLLRHTRELCSDDITYGRVSTSTELAEASSPNCSICLAPLHNAVTLPCSHMFCRGCIEEWLDRDRSCPNCRRDVPGSSPTAKDDSFGSVYMSIF